MVRNSKHSKFDKPLLVDYLATKQITESLLEYYSLKNEGELLNKLKSDFYYLSCRDISQNECCFPFYRGAKLKLTDNNRTCPLGIQWKRLVYDDKFGVDEAINGPLSSEFIKEKDILNFKLPDPNWFDFLPLAEECDLNENRIIVGGLWSAIHGDSYRMMGYENFLLNIALNKNLIQLLVNRMTDFYIEMNSRYFEAVKDKMDVFFMGNDFGSQSGLMISEEDWYDIYYTNYKKLIDLAHSFNLKVMVHSCGSIEPIIPYFIKLGVDIIDPVQTTAKGMDPKVLGEKYGKQISFHGAIDTQSVIPYGTSEDIETHVSNLILHLNKNKNYIAAPSNNFMTGTPPQNIETVYETINKLKSNEFLQ